MSASPIWNYMKWWEGKRCRMAGSTGPFRTVRKVEFVGPPSGVYGAAGLVFEGDSTPTWIPKGTSFRPGKKHVEIEPTPCKCKSCSNMITLEQFNDFGHCDACIESGRMFDDKVEEKKATTT